MVLIQHCWLEDDDDFADLSVPLRGLWFLSAQEEKNMATYEDTFRPLAGIMVLIRMILYAYEKVKLLSVPLRGYFPSPCGDYGSYLFVFRQGSVFRRPLFPSPCGDYGSYLFVFRQGSVFRRPLFPSPCGDYGSYQKHLHYRRRRIAELSVPLRGLWFLSVQRPQLLRGMAKLSVPLRGLWFLSWVFTQRSSARTVLSVPLRGLWFLSRHGAGDCGRGTLLSVPLRGLWFLSRCFSLTLS